MLTTYLLHTQCKSGISTKRDRWQSSTKPLLISNTGHQPFFKSSGDKMRCYGDPNSNPSIISASLQNMDMLVVEIMWWAMHADIWRDLPDWMPVSVVCQIGTSPPNARNLLQLTCFRHRQHSLASVVFLPWTRRKAVFDISLRRARTPWLSLQIW
jgi:hypothetical protein